MVNTLWKYERQGVKKMIQFKQEVSIIDEVDVLVCGGGVAGIAAAITSARNGCKTLLIEQDGFLGGNAEVGIWLGSYDRTGSFPVVAGVFQEIVNKLVEQGAAVHQEDDLPIGEPLDHSVVGSPYGGYGSHGRTVPYNREAFRHLSEKLILDAGGDLLLFTSAVKPYFDQERLKGVFVFNKNGLGLIKTKRVIDTTGDADIVARSGAVFRKGRPEDNKMAPATLMFSVDNVNPEEFGNYCLETGDNRFRALINRLKAQNKWPFPFDLMICMYRPFKKGKFLINTLRQCGIDGTDTRSITRGMIEGREQAYQLLDIIREYVPGFQRAILDETAARIGIRETRRIVGEYTLTKNDIIRGRSFQDTVALSGYKWDLPDPDSPSFQQLEKQEMPNYIEIPYRCLVPKDLKNIIVAGRCISTTWHALGPVRVMPVCFATGQAAGTAAALSLNNNIPFNEVDKDELIKLLNKQGAITKIYHSEVQET